MSHKDKINLCVICTSKVPTEKSDNKVSGEGDKDDDPANSSVIFFLNNLLPEKFLLQMGALDPGCVKQGVPKRMEDLITSKGYPSTWLSFCNDCRNFVEEARQIFLKIGRLQEQFDGFQKLVLTRIKDTFNEEEVMNKKNSNVFDISADLVRVAVVKIGEEKPKVQDNLNQDEPSSSKTLEAKSSNPSDTTTVRRTNPKRLATNRPKIKKRKRLEIRSKSGRLIKQPDSDTETYEEEEETRTPVVKVDQEKLMEMEFSDSEGDEFTVSSAEDEATSSSGSITVVDSGDLSPEDGDEEIHGELGDGTNLELFWCEYCNKQYTSVSLMASHQNHCRKRKE
ncbi:uncharacterized protein LOC110854625 isoform X1 [Folsomia candida]|uniref:uncharacterized protein LOC110854625 isoform X1 n=2 Tax=Folsomia candida TaxID=158441 RepID=UPI000B9026C5|nr:uncharacterized protein LOC110854625 isoform X1 [Folsomia candida]